MSFLKEAVIELGANLGDRQRNIDAAVQALGKLPETRVIAVSKYYETAPHDVPDKKNDYINCCVKLETALLPETLLGACLGIEAAMGRVRQYKNQARIIDVDLLLYEGENRDTKDLQLPHPRMLERAFVLVPLLDLYPDGNALGLDFSGALRAICSGVAHMNSYQEEQ